MKYLKNILNNFKIKSALCIFATAIAAVFFTGYLWGILAKTDSGIKMNHNIHAENGIECAKCHSLDNSNARFMTFSGHTACSECHDDKIKSQDPNACRLCHSDKDNKTSLRKGVQLSPSVNFDHKKHSDKNVKCVDCHKNANDSKKVSGNSMLPKMETCVECHKAKKVGKTDDCNSCHVSGFEQVKPASHTPFWMKTHGKEVDQAKIDNSCNTCHTKKYNKTCADCHQKEKPSDHTTAFRIRSHAQRALLNRESCNTCHQQSECTSCHKTQAPASHTGFWSAPYNRHCMNCHLSGSDYASGGVQGNCGFCHSGSSIYSKHTSKPRPAGHASASCACHSAQSIKHPYPSSTSSCRSCHK